jgi:hypothetical protein
MTIALEFLARIRGSLSSSGDGGVASLPVAEGLTIDFANGTGLNQGNAVYIDEFSIAASGSLDVDLSGSLTDRLGNALVFTAIKAVLVIADATNTNNVVVGGDANAVLLGFGAAAQSFAVPPGGCMALANPSAAGWTVTAGTGDILQLANSGAGSAVTGTLVVIGEV